MEWSEKEMTLIGQVFLKLYSPKDVETTSILVVLEGIYSYQFWWNYLKNHWFFSIFFCIFGIHMKLKFWKKKWASSVKYFWSYSFRNICFFKCITGLISKNPFAVNLLTSAKTDEICRKVLLCSFFIILS